MEDKKKRACLQQQVVEDAFRQAENELGSTWKLKGAGHCPRVTLKGPYSGPAARGAKHSWDNVVLNSFHSTRVFPLELAARAAAILHVGVCDITNHEVGTTGYSISSTVTVKVDTIPAAIPELRRPALHGEWG